MKYLFLWLIFIFCNLSYAQTQHGIVKTRGRIVNGQIVNGTMLEGAVIALNFGNSLISDKHGAFSFAVPPSKTYSLVYAKKQGYTLSDADFTKRSFTYSELDPFYVILEDEKQRQADINTATRKIRKTLIAQLNILEDEIEALKESNKISEQEYQDRLKQLYETHSNSEELVRKMAERYATTDYDQLDDFNRQVQLFIEEGKLQKADSMIQSKGNIEERITEYQKIIEANKKERVKLEQSDLGAVNIYKDLSQDLYRRHEIFLQKFQHDSALYYLKLRADLDTTNAVTAWEYANLCYQQKKLEESTSYYIKCLQLFIREDNKNNIAAINLSLGNIYFYKQDFNNSIKCFEESLKIYEDLIKHQYSTELHSGLATVQNNLGNIYLSIHNIKYCMKYYSLALTNRKQIISKSNKVEDRAKLAQSLYNFGLLYKSLKDYPNSHKYYLMALENYNAIFERDPDKYRYDLAATQNNIGTLLMDMKDRNGSEKYLNSALQNKKILFKQNPNIYRLDIVGTLYNLGDLYYDNNDYEKSKYYYTEALTLVNEFPNQNTQNSFIKKIETKLQEIELNSQ